MFSHLEYSDFTYLLEREGWVKQITDPAEIERLIGMKRESQSQFNCYYEDAEWGGCLYELEVKITLKDSSVLYALTEAIEPSLQSRGFYPRLSRMFGSCPRKRSRKRKFQVPLGCTVQSLD